MSPPLQGSKWYVKKAMSFLHYQAQKARAIL